MDILLFCCFYPLITHNHHHHRPTTTTSQTRKTAKDVFSTILSLLSFWDLQTLVCIMKEKRIEEPFFNVFIIETNLLHSAEFFCQLLLVWWHTKTHFSLVAFCVVCHVNVSCNTTVSCFSWLTTKLPI